MDAELKRRVEALRRPLELAAANDFAGVRRVQGLGNVLRIACDGLMQRWSSEQLAAWRIVLAKWEQLPIAQQEAEVARGMRLIARLPSAPSLASAKATIEDIAAKAMAAKSMVAKPTSGAPSSAMVAKSTSAAALNAKASGEKASGEKASGEKASSEKASSEKARAKGPRAAAAETIADPLGAPTHTLPGIGPAFAEKLAEKNLETVEDLLWCLPRRYDDVRDAKQLAEVCEMDEGMRATFSAKVASARMVFVRRRRWAEVRLGAVDVTQPASCVVRWFNVWAGIEKRMPAGSVVTLSGVVKKRSGRLELANPDILAIDVADAQLPLDAASDGSIPKAKKAPPTIIPRYPEVQGVPASRLRVACQTACARVGASADDGVPKSIEAASGMPSLAETLARLHDPPSDITVEDLAALNRGDSPWQRRLAFGELFALGVAVAMRRKERRADAAVACARTPGLDDAVAKALPFRMTTAQQRAVREMGDDLARPVPMNRLLQGDVGAGKTAVAFAAALQVARAGRQTAVMAPTELLAEQHFETWKKWAAVTGLRVELLTASTQKGVRQTLLALLAAGKIDVLLGTHSLIAEAVGFAALGLVVIDEQHRFGVAQRAKLRDKGDGQGAPHLLVMTATPIPRTLALTAYGDLDVSILDELPPGREPAKTKVVAGKRGEQAAYKLIAERVAAGERAYVVCPKVEMADEHDENAKDWKDATSVASEMAAALPQLRVGLVHGRLDSEARDRVMRAFKQGELDVLVATTVIEVGVDVPSATVMVIHDAERFGLAQLHQLRGRVGRGGGAAHCVLVTGGRSGAKPANAGERGSISEDGRRRLDAMVRTTDGFLIAEEDLALRGPGELLGPRQAGIPRLRFGSLAQHTELLLEARGHAERILDEDPGLVRPEHAALRAALARRLAQSVYGAESG
ncbi:MAG TPA: ATP-dependent DNA helicase RecG [Kofleriaceae bacterium]|nr:ATP-dependent DNA helicase RecG [Kofleriaceae bacterium]